jgi:Cof subfamily protein (haloacid dehalogenase superfamily)
MKRMSYKMICIDLDGTLLNSCKKITATTLEILRRAGELGVRVVITTGRKYKEASYFADLIGLNAPLITANGAYIRERDHSQVISCSPLGGERVLKLYELCNRYRVAYCFHTSEREYFGNSLARLLHVAFWRYNLKPERMLVQKQFLLTSNQWSGLLVTEKERLLKCVVHCFSPAKLSRLRQDLLATNELEVASSGTANLELTRKGVTKGEGVAILARHFGLQRREIIAIGDNENDLPMIEYAGLGVAMGNAVARVKEKADAVTATNEADGVARVVRKYVLDM